MQDYNGWQVKVDSAHQIWAYGVVLGHCPSLPASTRGWLGFCTKDINLLAGPWGPDPADHLMLSGEVARRAAVGTSDWLSIVLQPGVPELALRVRRAGTCIPLPGRRVWLAIHRSRINYIPGVQEPRCLPCGG
ncbi:hypothetical protein [Marinobacterium weihaiense]|uniref:Uncharacterized protein n=1 Tax=Marinobacterium weihaiense TaxID=2851016 RepID=A0ABS6MAG2_9GAMM|nr:hypothetical protein [Marinobacterium weihaiense]MBV0932884.1 hypothetical protein [Marinobacterium weihaiense]